MEEGYDFHWYRGQTPYWVDRHRHKSYFIVENFVPYLVNPAERIQAFPAATSGIARIPSNHGDVDPPDINAVGEDSDTPVLTDNEQRKAKRRRNVSTTVEHIAGAEEPLHVRVSRYIS